MLTNEELERKLDALAQDNVTLRRRITDLEESIDSHVGIDYGAAQQLSPHPSQQIALAEYGGGAMRLDEYGIRIKVDDSGYDAAVIFNDAFYESPSTAYPYAGLVGSKSAVTTEVGLYAINSAAANDFTLLKAITGTFGNYIQLSAGAVFFLIGNTSDQTALANDGAFQYRTDIDRFRVRANGITRNLTMDGTNTTLTIATGAVTITTSFHAIDTEAAAATDDLDTINGGQTGQVLYIHAANGARDVVAKDGTGNLKLAGDFTMDNTEDTLTLIFDGTNWLELARSGNGA